MEALSIVRVRGKKCWRPGTGAGVLVFNGEGESVWEDENFWRRMVAMLK